MKPETGSAEASGPAVDRERLAAAVEATLDSTIARDVQAALVRADAELPSDSSYLESLWYKAAYLGGRDSIATAVSSTLRSSSFARRALNPAHFCRISNRRRRIVVASAS